MSERSRPRWDDLPRALREALDACWSALDACPWELPDESLTSAVEDALGVMPLVLRGTALAEARHRRPDLARGLDHEGGVLVLPGVSRHEANERARARLWSALEPAAESGLDGIDWARVAHVASEPPEWRRHAVLAWRSAQSVVPMWLHAHPDDERALALVEELELAIAGHASMQELRHALEHGTPVADPGLSAMRAIVLAHDRVTQSEARIERVSLPELCAYAWLDAPAELVPDARSGEPMARAEAWFRWWLAEAVPGAWRAA